MIRELIIRFVLGGIVVSGIALLSDCLKPKRFAGLFGAAPSVALATLALTAGTNGKVYASIEARSMAFGALSLLLYCYSVFRISIRLRRGAFVTTLSLIPLWMLTAAGLWLAFLRPPR
jgi:uncharacterized membrane protein (GlpM family)